MSDLLTKYLISELVDGKKVTAVFGGGFKPPTKGHFNVVKQALDTYKDIDKFIIYVGGKPRDGITQEQSMLVWEIYKEVLGDKVEIIPSKNPIGDVRDYPVNNPKEQVYFVIGAREGNEEDMVDFTQRTKNVEEKYPNVSVKLITLPDSDVSGTKARAALKNQNKTSFFTFLPDAVPDAEKEEIYNILEPNILRETLKENTIPSIDILDKIDELTNHMRKKGYKIDPIPSITLVDDDIENAEEFLGKTAYYDPNDKSIVLYTYGRHPKDIVRSFAHEMIHHIQNLEGRLGDVSTTNTLEDDHVNDLEKEANLNGTMEFRNWTDGLKEEQISEVGEATSKPYEWEITSTKRGDVEFGFTTDSGIEYEVQLVKLDYEDDETGEPINGLEIGFGAGEKGTDKSDSAVINRGEVFRVMATITNIIQTGIKLIPDFKNTNALIYNPAPKKGEDVLGNQRDKLYQAFIKKVFPKARFETDGSALVAKLYPPK